MKRSFILHLDSLEILHDLSSDEAGELLKAMYYYHLDKEYDLPSHLRLLFIQFKNQFKRDENKYDETCERNRANGKKGGRPKKPKQSEETQKTHSVILKPKKAYNDNDSDNDNKSDNNKVNVEGFLNWFNEMMFKHNGRVGKFKTLSKTDVSNLTKLKQLNYEVEDWEKVFMSMSKNQWVKDNKMCTPTHYLRNDNFQKYLNQYEEVKDSFKFAWQ